MKLPNASQAIIDPAKLRDYLLSPSHPVGRFKAPFFAALGYAQDRWRQLEADLRSQHLSQDSEQATTSNYGVKYQIRGMLSGAAGRSAEVVSVWIIRAGEDAPRFITAYPGGAP